MSKELEAEVKHLREQLARVISIATAQSEQRIKELERKLAEQRVALTRIAQFGFSAGWQARVAREVLAGGKEELTRLLQEAEQRGAVKALREAAANIREQGPRPENEHYAQWLEAMADELEGRK